MTKHMLLAVALAGAALAVHAAEPAPSKAGQPDASREAKATFLKKCFRNRTKESCEAPPAARARS
ncbi:MAG: hypothetical protein ACJ8GO_17355 [Ramlibacter sp.]